MEYIYLLHYETDAIGTVWTKAFQSRVSARKGLGKALASELECGNDFKSGDEDGVTLRHGQLYIQEILIETP